MSFVLGVLSVLVILHGLPDSLHLFGHDPLDVQQAFGFVVPGGFFKLSVFPSCHVQPIQLGTGLRSERELGPLRP